MARFDFIYGQPCRTPLSWDQLKDRFMMGLEVIQDMEERMKYIRKRIKEA
jgi:hypothetical protein